MRRANAELRASSRRRSAPGLPGDDAGPAARRPSRRSRATSVSSPFSGTSRATQRTTTSSSVEAGLARSSPARLAASSSARSAQVRHVDRVREDPDPLRRRAASDHRLACRRADDEHARGPRRMRGTTAPLTARRQPARGSRSWLSTGGRTGTPARAAPGDRGLRRERAPAGDDDDVGLRALEAHGRYRASPGSRGGSGVARRERDARAGTRCGAEARPTSAAGDGASRRRPR